MMKKEFHGIGGWMKTHWMEIAAGAMIALIAILAFSIGYIHCLAQHREDVLYYESMITAPEPTVCALCRNNARAKVHAPCIVNLATGEVAELAIYDPHPTEIGEVTETPKKGHVSYFTGAGALIEQNLDQGYCKATLAKEEPIGPGYFCYECRCIIAELDTDKKGYVIADMYDPETVVVYPIRDGAKYEVRDYLVTVHMNENDSFEIDVHRLWEYTN